MRILALNCGSSSVKATLIRSDDESRLLDLRVTSIGAKDAAFEVDGKSREFAGAAPKDAVAAILAAAMHVGVDAVAHRVVHGAAQFTQPTIIDAEVETQLDELSTLAPLHNPVAIDGIRAARHALPSIPHVAVFDTAFHATLPAHAREYALSREVTQRFGIRRYGFHGINHGHVAQTAAQYLQRPIAELRIISCHLGNGASVAAIERGRSVDTSMGMTPLEGLMMGSRAGDVDAGVLLQLLRSGDFAVNALDDLLNRKSGLTALTGTNDLRTIERNATAGDEACRHALAAYAYRVRKYIGAYAAAMGGVDAIVFTAGVGEHSATVRSLCVEHLEFLGVLCDPAANRKARVTIAWPVARITTSDSRVAVLVVRADEEMAMVREVAPLIASR